MSDVLAEFRQAEATIVSMRDAATPLPWHIGVRNSKSASIQAGPGMGLLRHNAPGRAGIAVVEAESADLIVLSVSVLVEAVLPVIQDAIKRIDNYPGGRHVGLQENALRLARYINKINERTAS